MSRPVTVRSVGGGLELEVQVGGHRLAVDEPAEQGGRDAGPTPVELLLAALGS
jgi:putative redox protein